MSVELQTLNLRDGKVLENVGPLQFQFLSRLHGVPSGKIESARRIYQELSVNGDSIRSTMSNLKIRLGEVDWVVLRIRAEDKPQNSTQKLTNTFYGFSPRSHLEEYGIEGELSNKSEVSLVWRSERVRPLLLPSDLEGFNQRFGDGSVIPRWKGSRYATQAQILEHYLDKDSDDLGLDNASRLISDAIGLMPSMAKAVRSTIEPLDIDISKDNLPGLLLYYLIYRQLSLDGKIDVRKIRKDQILATMSGIAEVATELGIVRKYLPSLQGREQDYRYKESLL